MKIINVEQGTKDWQDIRRCKITGTKLKAVMGTSESRRNLIAELIAEEATEQSKIIKPTSEMERGNTEEIFAIRAFEDLTGKKVDRVGICIDEKRDWVALSPDGLIKNSKGKYNEAVEVKCPDSKKAILYKIENQISAEETGLLNAKGALLSGAPFLGIPSEYKWQVVHYFVVNKDLEKLNFVIYDPRFINEEAKLYIVVIERNNELLQEAIKEAEQGLKDFKIKWDNWKNIILPVNF